MKCVIEIAELSVKPVIMEADTVAEAIDNVSDLYFKKEILLKDEDVKQVSFKDLLGDLP